MSSSQAGMALAVGTRPATGGFRKLISHQWGAMQPTRGSSWPLEALASIPSTVLALMTHKVPSGKGYCQPRDQKAAAKSIPGTDRVAVLEWWDGGALTMPPRDSQTP